MRATILVLVSLCLGINSAPADPASSPNSPSPLKKEPGHSIKIDGRKMRVRNFRTTSTSTDSHPISTSTSTSITYTHDAPPTTTTTTTTKSPPIIFRNEMLAESSSKSTQWVQMSKTKRQNHFGQSDNVIDLGEQDLEDLNLIKQRDPDTTKDDPNAPIILQFNAPSSPFFMDPAYISKIISQQLGEGYIHTNYTIAPSAITSKYSAPVPKKGFTLPAPSLNSYSSFAPTQEPITVHPPTKHEFPQAPTAGYSPFSSSSPVASNSNYELLSQGPSPAPSTSNSSSFFSPVVPDSNYGTPSQGYVPLHSVLGHTPVYSSGERNPGFVFVPLHPVQMYSLPPTGLTFMYHSPSAPPSGSGYSAVSVGPSEVAGTFESSSTPTAPNYQHGSGSSQGYSSINEYEAPEYKAPKYTAPEYTAPEHRAPEYKAPENKTPENKVPEYKAPEYVAPEYTAPENKAPENRAPEYMATDYKAPEYIGTELPQQREENDAQSFGPSGYEDSYCAPKNIYRAMKPMILYLPPSQPPAAPGIIYGTPAEAQAPQGRPNSIISWPSDKATTYGEPMPIYIVPPYIPTSSYGPPPAPSVPSAPTDTYDLPTHYTPPAPAAPSLNYGIQEAEDEQKRPQVHKTIYVNLSPEENYQKPKTIKYKVNLPPQRHYKIVFFKAPTPPPEDEVEVELPAAPESKTLVYVLTKKPEAPKPIKIVTPPPTKPSPPAVHFIQYKDKKSKDAQAPSGGHPDFTPPKGDYGLLNSAPDSNFDSYAAGSENSEQGVGYDISSSEPKIEVKVSKLVKE